MLARLGQLDEVVELPRATAGDAHVHSVFFVELMMAMDLYGLADGATSGGAGASDISAAGLGLAKRAVAAMSGCAAEVGPVLVAWGMSLDAVLSVVAAAG